MCHMLYAQDAEKKREFAQTYLSEMSREAIFCDRKRLELVRLWPSMFVTMVQTALAQMAEAGSYAKKTLENI